MKLRITTLAAFVFFSLGTLIYAADMGLQLLSENHGCKLAVPSTLDDLVSDQHKDIGLIKLALEGELKELFKRHEEGLPVDYDNFHSVVVACTLRGDLPYEPEEIQIFLQEAKKVDAGLSVMARIKDGGGIRTYYAVFSLERDEAEGFPIKLIVTEEEFEKHDGLKRRLPVRGVKDERAIERYVRHEKGIDAALKFAHQNGLAAELPDDSDFPGRSYKKFVKTLMRQLEINVENPDPDRLVPIEDRKFFLVKLTDDVKRMLTDNPATVIDQKGEEHEIIIPSGHSSNHSVHIFVGEKLFDALTNKDWRRTLAPSERIRLNRALIHEVGVMLGFPIIEVMKDTSGSVTQVKNLLDKKAEKELPGLFKELGLVGYVISTKELITARIADLDRNLLTRDYAAGELDSLTYEKVLEMINAAYYSAGDDIAYPFSERTQEALSEISRIGEAADEQMVPLDNVLYFRISYAYVFCYDNFNGVIRFMNRLRDGKDTEELGEMSRAVLSDRAFIELYFVALAMDTDSVQAACNSRRSFLEYHADQLFGEDRGHQVMSQIYGGIETYTNAMSMAMIDIPLAFVDHYQKKGEYDKALRTVDNILMLSVNEEIVLGGITTVSIDRLREAREDASPQLRDFLDEAIKMGQGLSRAGTVSTYKESIDMLLGFRSEISREAKAEAEKAKIAAEIKHMEAPADQAGKEIPTHPNTRYTLLVPLKFFAEGELKLHTDEYGSRFNIGVIKKDDDNFADGVLETIDAKGMEPRTIALVPDSLPEGELDKLKGKGIRFVRISTSALNGLQGPENKDKREKFQKDAYAMMLLVRNVTGETDRNSAVYQLLEFYLKSHFELNGISSEEYIEAIISTKTDSIQNLLKGILLTEPIEKYRIPSYGRVVATLEFA